MTIGNREMKYYEMKYNATFSMHVNENLFLI